MRAETASVSVALAVFSSVYSFLTPTGRDALAVMLSALVNLDPPCLATGMSEISTTKVRGSRLDSGTNAEMTPAELDDDALSDGGEELTEEQERASLLL